MQTLPDRYQPTGMSSDGGMGSVIICNDKVLERQVAIKVIHKTTHRRRILDELAALLKMRSKHVVQVYDILQFDDDDLGIVQEFIDGRDLFEGYIATSSPTAFYKQIWQIASGICDIHALGVIHRDIKPNNMKTDPEGVIKIFDFGLARDEGPTAATVGFVGTPGFAAPELYAGIAKFTKAVDTYAFGATALYLATGCLPCEQMANISFTVAPEIANCLDACLALLPEDRPAMSSVKDILSKYLLFDRHQALVVFQNKARYLDSANRTVRLNLASVGSIDIHYDGLEFRITNCSGEVYVNNRTVAEGNVLPGSCVVTLGDQHRRFERVFITFDLSNPEIVL
ncbi:MAG: serine/threonine-protein kinase [Proteobacteria bacterium]|nr:serine/threonine-protein kinase [Pseudomonadota bacterium]